MIHPVPLPRRLLAEFTGTALLVAVVLTWLSGLDYARVAPGLLRKRVAA